MLLLHSSAAGACSASTRPPAQTAASCSAARGVAVARPFQGRAAPASKPSFKRSSVIVHVARGPEQPRDPESEVDRETAKLALRLLTARATAVVLQNIGQVNTFQAAWLNEYCQRHPPLEGNAFLAALMQAKPEAKQDPYTGSVHHINPAALAAAILSTREALAQQLAKALPGRVADANIQVMRAHLEAHTYTSGSNLEVKPSFREYRRRSTQQRQLQQ